MSLSSGFWFLVPWLMLSPMTTPTPPPPEHWWSSCIRCQDPLACFPHGPTFAFDNFISFDHFVTEVFSNPEYGLALRFCTFAWILLNSIAYNCIRVCHYNYEDHPERFDCYHHVLYREALSGSRHYWEVERHGVSTIGVVYKGMSRRGTNSWIGRNKSWSLLCSGSNYWYIHNEGLPSHGSCMAMFPKELVCFWTGQLASCLSTESPLVHWRTFTQHTEPVYPGFRIDPRSSLSLTSVTDHDQETSSPGNRLYVPIYRTNFSMT